MSTSDEEMLVVRTLRQGFENYGGPGSAINPATNPFYINARGEFDLLKTAQLLLLTLGAFKAHKDRIAQEEATRHLANAARELAAAQAGEAPAKELV